MYRASGIFNSALSACAVSGARSPIRASHVPATGNDFLALQRHGRAEKLYFCADTLRVGLQPPQPNRHARGRALIAINARGRTQVVDN